MYRYVCVSWMMAASLFCHALAQAPAPAQLPPEVLAYADLILFNGKVLVADDQFTIAQAVAVRDGKILAVGTDQRIQAMAGPSTRRIDLAGKTLVPGFYDTHLHLDGAFDANYVGPAMRHRVWDGSYPLKMTRAEFLEKLGEVVKKQKPGEWVLSFAPIEFIPLLRKELDEIAPNNPLELRTGAGPGEEPVYANSMAIKLAKMPTDTPGLLKDANGEPTGTLITFAAGVMEYETIPYVGIEGRLKPLKQAMKIANSLGITMIATRSKPISLSAIKTLWEQHELTTRWRIATEMIRHSPNAEMILKRVGNLDGLGDDMFKLWGMQPGNPDGNDAVTWMMPRDKFLHTPQGERKDLIGEMYTDSGIDYWFDRESSGYGLVILANRYGWRTTMIHTAGDRAASMLLEAYEKAHKENPITGRRFALDHALMLNPDHLEKMRELGVIPSVYMANSIGNDPSEKVRLYGPDKVANFTPVKSMIAAGLKPVAESDAGLRNGGKFTNPLWNIEKLVTRTDEKGKVWGPHERIDRKEALWMYTNWASYYSGDEKILGTLEPGKLADLVVLEGDFMAVPEEFLSDLRVAMTFVGGKLVYERAERLPNDNVEFQR
ncbi:MAG: amidohydrolase family protein [Acidobacteria bacterium]|nr:amidohydrolase family protein [Acidobacteriota bacterium]